MLNCNPIGTAADLTNPPPQTTKIKKVKKRGFSLSSWTNKTKKKKSNESPPIESHQNRLYKIISSSSDEEEERSNTPVGLFSRGYNSLRSSLTRLKMSAYNNNNNNNTSDNSKNVEVTLNDIEPLKLKEIGSGSSADSGLGEDSSDLDTNRDSTLITPVPILVSSLRKVSSSSRSTSSSSTSTLPVKKHVIIREPSLSALPSTSRRNQNRCRVVTTRIYSAPSRLPSIRSTGTVSSVWNHLYQSAYNETLEKLSGHNYSIRLIFEVHSDLSRLDSDEISDLIHTVYKILYLPPSSSMVLHIIRRFMIVLIEFVDLNGDEKRRLGVKFRDLLRTSEMTCYRNLDQVLQRTRKTFIELWCALLTVPFNEPFLHQQKKKLLLEEQEIIHEKVIVHQEN